MKVAFYKYEYGDWKDWLIVKLTRSKYSHIELIFDDGSSLSSSPRDGGVRFKEIEYKPERWDFLNIDSEIDRERDEYLDRAFDLINHRHRYDWLSIFLGWAGIKSYNRFNCVNACMYVIDADFKYYTPQGVYEELKRNGAVGGSLVS